MCCNSESCAPLGQGSAGVGGQQLTAEQLQQIKDQIEVSPRSFTIIYIKHKAHSVVIVRVWLIFQKHLTPR